MTLNKFIIFFLGSFVLINSINSQDFYDINNDGIINDSDFIMLLSFVMNDNGLMDSADINFDSAVDIFDLLLLSDFLQNM